ncbi:MAG TPA: hypothetical protein VNN80_33610, partial [Polyangiaceae bacterium]|nr:hypothetical protein [Polyangiaceae bacterium]
MSETAGTDEFIRHPNPREVTAVPAALRLGYIVEQLEHSEDAISDLERTLGLGQLARILNVADVEATLVPWLEAHPTPIHYDAAGLFFWGYWSGREPNPQAVLTLLEGLDAYADYPSVRDTLVAALGAAFATTTRDDIRGLIRQTFDKRVR